MIGKLDNYRILSVIKCVSRFKFTSFIKLKSCSVCRNVGLFKFFIELHRLLSLRFIFSFNKFYSLQFIFWLLRLSFFSLKCFWACTKKLSYSNNHVKIEHFRLVCLALRITFSFWFCQSVKEPLSVVFVIKHLTRAFIHWVFFALVFF